MNFQYYRPGLMPMFGAAAPLIGQPIAPRGFLPAQGQMRPVLTPSAVAAQAAVAQGLLGAYPVGQTAAAAMRLHPQHAMMLASAPNSNQALMAAASPSPGFTGDVKDEKEMSLSPISSTPLGGGGPLGAAISTNPLAPSPHAMGGMYPGRAVAPAMLAMAPAAVWPGDVHGGRMQEADLVNSQYMMAQQMGSAPMSSQHVMQHEAQPVDTTVKLDQFNCDLHLKLDDDCYGGEPLTNPPGFCFCWAGARSTYGVTHGKVCYEVFISEHLAVDFGEDHIETNPHVMRIGWSTEDSDLQLGEVDDSYGYGGTGKFSVSCKFRNYGETFGAGDVITALLDLEARPATVSYAKNGQWLGVATRLTEFRAGVLDAALFPHVLTKNSRFEVNFGQRAPWYPPPAGFLFPQQLQPRELIRGMLAPDTKAECEMMIIVGLPGVGKTTWALKMKSDYPARRYNIIGTDTLIDKMKVMGLPRKNNYSGRWNVLIDKATACLNKLFQVAAKQKRSYILDQTNVYASARKRKLKPFAGFQRICAVLQTEDAELERRAWQRTHQDGKFVPESAVMEMKANFSLPSEQDLHVDRIIWIELGREKTQQLVDQYNQAAGYPGGKGQHGQQYTPNRQWSDRGGRDQDEIGGKKPRLDAGSGLDFIKQQYGDVHPPPPPSGRGSLTAWDAQPAAQYAEQTGYGRRQGDQQMYEYGARGYTQDGHGGSDAPYKDYSNEVQNKDSAWSSPAANKDTSRSYWSPQYGQERGGQRANEQTNYDYYGNETRQPAQSGGLMPSNRPDGDSSKSAREAYQDNCMDYWKQQGGGWGSNVPPPPPPDSPPHAVDNWQQGSSNKPWQTTDSSGLWQAESSQPWQSDNSKSWQSSDNKSWPNAPPPPPGNNRGFGNYGQSEMKDDDGRHNDKPRRSRWGPQADSTQVSSSDNWQTSQYESQQLQPDWQRRSQAPQEMSQTSWSNKPADRFGEQSSEGSYNDQRSGGASRSSDKFSRQADSSQDAQKRSFPESRDGRFSSNRESDNRGRNDGDRDSDRSNRYDRDRDSERSSRNRIDGGRDMERSHYDDNRGSDRHSRNRSEGSRDPERSSRSRFDSNRDSDRSADRNAPARYDSEKRTPSGGDRKPDSFDSYADRTTSGGRSSDQRASQDDRHRSSSDNRFSSRDDFGENRSRDERDSSRSGRQDGRADRRDSFGKNSGSGGNRTRESRFDKPPPPTSQTETGMRHDIKQERDVADASGLTGNTSTLIKAEPVDVKAEPLVKQEPIDKKPAMLGAKQSSSSTGSRDDFASDQPKAGMPDLPKPGMSGPSRPDMPGPPRQGMTGPPKPGMSDSPSVPKLGVPPPASVTPKLEVSAPSKPMDSNPGLLPQPRASFDGPRPDMPGSRLGLMGLRPDMRGPRPDIRGPRPDMHGPRPDIRGPRPDIRGPRPDMRGPRPDMRGPRPDMHGPRPDMRGPRPDMRGPRPDMRGPRPDMRGPRPDMRGPRPDIRGPRPDMQGPRPDMRGPKPDMRGPRPDMRGPRPTMRGPRPGGLNDSGMGGMRPQLGPGGRGFGRPDMMGGRGMGGPPGFRGPRPPFMR